MHISETGVLDDAAYAPAEDSIPERSNEWADLAVVVPVAVLYALVALLTGAAMTASGTGVSWVLLG